MREAHFPHHTIQPLRGSAARLPIRGGETRRSNK
jgi:hypothetical protein